MSGHRNKKADSISCTSNGAPRHGRTSRAGGFTLVEVLVAGLVVSIGLLAVAQLQGSALRAAHRSVQRLDAVQLELSLVDRLRATHGVDDARESAAVIEWLAAVSAALPQGTGAVQIQGRVVSVSVEWADPQAARGTMARVHLRTTL